MLIHHFYKKRKDMENKQDNVVKNAIILCLIFLGVLIGVSFISTTILVLFKVSTDFIVKKWSGFCFIFSFILTMFIKYKRSHKMPNFRYWFSFVIFFAGVIFTVRAGGGNLLTLIEIPSLIITGIVPFLFVCILFGFKEMLLAFSIQSIKDIEKEPLKKALRFFEMYSKITFISGVISVIIGIVNMLSNLDDKAAIGPNLALALISILYTCIIYVVLIVPFIIYIKNKLDRCSI